jgi:molecular chaperone DnaK (HSP70)
MARRFVVGIDLGTTHTVVAFSEITGAGGVRVFDLPQLVTPTETAARPLLPSVLFAPLDAEHVSSAWSDPPWITGELARRRGLEVPGRLVASAKSWLSHAAVDRTAPILPWGSDEGPEACPKISPCTANAALLTHVRRAWDVAHADAPLGEQEVVLTVPASFDEVARELTVAAAHAAGLSVRLLEEPQAAFYDYRSRVGDGPLESLLGDDGSLLVLVCDVGGGTTDLSLLRARARRSAGEPLEITRTAVGRHLLLGGDNMDLALAHVAETRLGDERLDPGRYGQLLLACRAAKETLLAEAAPDDVGVSVTRRGARLVGGTLSARLSRDEVVGIVLDGFFPKVTSDSEPVRARSGLLGFGLPYERDVAVTRHVAAFFKRHAEGALAPRAVLLNGGVFHAKRIVERLTETLDGWGGPPVTVLPHADPDLAVARGAVAYALARHRGTPVIKAGAARGYYVEVAAKPPMDRAVVCVVPRGTPEAVPLIADGTPLALVVGRPARFDLFASDNASGHQVGQVVSFGDVDLDPLPPVFTTFEEKTRREESLRVAIQAELSAIGTLDLACVEVDPPPGAAPRRFRLAFTLREGVEPPASVTPRSSVRAPSRAREDALTAVDRVFGKSVADAPTRGAKDLVRELERLLGDRGEWDAATSREIFDAVFRGHKSRRRSLDHERTFWQLAGFCLRPGVGDPGDAARVAGLFKLFPEKLTFTDQPRAWQQFWFAWRRVAAGLDEASQVALRDAVDPFLAPKEAGRKLPKWKPEALDALLEMASSLERVPPARRSELGAWLLERTWTDRDPRLWGALGRLGARAPAYASASYVLPPPGVERWLDHLLREKWGEVPTAAEAALRMARVTGDRARDVSERVRKEVARRLAAAGVAPEQVRTVEELVEVAEAERAAFLGEGIPAGLRLLA